MLRELRMRKSLAEVAALREAGAAIDSVHAQVAQWLKAGRTEAEVGRDIADAILAAGHARVDFIIVGAGPNGASPHHELSDRVIQAGEPVVVDIGGTMPSGYCSDSTRTYAVGQPGEDFVELYRRARGGPGGRLPEGRPGGHRASVDAAARDVIEAAGHGDLFVHRTGHGIGLETHEEPVHRLRQRAAAGAGDGVLDRAGHLRTPAGTGHGSRTSWSSPRTASSG